MQQPTAYFVHHADLHYYCSLRRVASIVMRFGILLVLYQMSFPTPITDMSQDVHGLFKKCEGLV